MSSRVDRFAWIVVGSAVVGCGNTGGGDCPVGDPGCPCAAGTCPAGLVCRDDLCVFASDDGTDDSPPDDDDDDADDDDDSADATTAGSSADDDTGPADPNAPQVFELFTDVEMLEEHGTLMFTAQVTDVDGLDDIVGGTLVDDATGAVYAPFSAISEGTFVAAVSWNDIDGVEPIVFEHAGSRTYRAEFVDQAQLVGGRTIQIPFHCEVEEFYPSAGVCGDGECRPLGTLADCEGCNMQCETCYDGVCLMGELGSCFDPSSSSQTCDDICAADGYPGCVNACGANAAGITAYSTLAECTNDDVESSLSSCDAPVNVFYRYAAVRCCCGPI